MNTDRTQRSEKSEASKSTMKQKLYKQKVEERKKVNKPKKRRKTSHYKDSSIVQSCCICKATTPLLIISIHFLDYTIGELCMDRHFKNTEDAQKLLKGAIKISRGKMINITSAMHEIQGLKKVQMAANQSAKVK